MRTTADLALQSLLDKEAIRECLYRYCRGIDRVDEAALRSAYWPDATDHHGPFIGSANGFIDWAVERLRTSRRMVHIIGNISIELRGTVAAVESYFQAFQEDGNDKGHAEETFMCGRYVDLFECRDSEWRISSRKVVFDWIRKAQLPDSSDGDRFGPRQPVGCPKPDDAYYALLNDARLASLP